MVFTDTANSLLRSISFPIAEITARIADAMATNGFAINAALKALMEAMPPDMPLIICPVAPVIPPRLAVAASMSSA
nr:MAG: hypothetical protein [Bacteriophage sp.]